MQFYVLSYHSSLHPLFNLSLVTHISVLWDYIYVVKCTKNNKITSTTIYKKVNVVLLTLNTNQNLLLIIGITTTHLTLTKKNEKKKFKEKKKKNPKFQRCPRTNSLDKT